MLPPVNATASAAPAGVAASPAPARRAEPDAASAVVTVSAAGTRAAASQDTAKVATGTVHVSADVNRDGTVSDQEHQTETAQLALKRAQMEGGPNLDRALEAYQAVASLADVQR